jgi:hypothetical protein
MGLSAPDLEDSRYQLFELRLGNPVEVVKNPPGDFGREVAWCRKFLHGRKRIVGAWLDKV